MTLVACRECGHQVSHTAPKCPHCGAAGTRARGLSGPMALFLLVAFAALVVWLTASCSSATAPPSSSLLGTWIGASGASATDTCPHVAVAIAAARGATLEGSYQAPPPVGCPVSPAEVLTGTSGSMSGDVSMLGNEQTLTLRFVYAPGDTFVASAYRNPGSPDTVWMQGAALEGDWLLVRQP